MDEDTEEAVHATKGAAVDAVELAVDDRQRGLVHAARQVVEGVLADGAHPDGVQCDGDDVG